ncbi:MAG: tRNA (N(6)-L-threonylcarbamoyladenosine(37)-C(2))-methylthiotransferase MtaB [Lachnospiraceae bacterium]|nr:tRNA (N(6)-L-threonylcarbamoyladenosine(37)-C(2))-methylthiotransferase MtaB [Lachnospiraceae bacterium]
MKKLKKVAIHNLGCKVNSYEAAAMQESIEQAGYEIVPFVTVADVYIVNTCTVTNIASRKSRQMLHKARKMNSEAIIVAAGCYVHTAEQENTIADVVDVMIGNNKKQDLPAILRAMEKRDKTDCVYKAVVDINTTQEYEPLKISKPRAHTRVNIKIQDGCNQFCSYCIIPMVRGRVRSRALSEVVSEVKELAASGCREVVLTGIHLSSYGTDFDDASHLLALIQAIHRVEGICRIRVGSLEPGIITKSFVEGLTKLEKFCPHFHLSLQSGCDETLKRMNRHYTTKTYWKKCQLLRRYFEHPAITTDIIVGFPGETEEEFRQTKAFIDEIDFYKTHIFKYSRRVGTKAATMPNQVPSRTSGKRSKELIQLGEIKQKAFETYYIGKEVAVLVEDKMDATKGVYQVGYTKEYVKIRIDAKKNLHNQVVSVHIQEESQIVH